MTQENKELLLKDLCGRLPYGVKVKIYNHWRDECEDETLTLENYAKLINTFSVEDVKPYLFPLSSMTEEQRKEFDTTLKYLPAEEIDVWTLDTYDWCDKNHFDYRGLIPIGLATDATNLNIY